MHAQNVNVKFNEWFTIPAAIQGHYADCLVDTRASINLIDECWLKTNLDDHSFVIHPSKIQKARAANGSDMHISGLVTLSLTIEDSCFDTIFHVTPNLSESAILGNTILETTWCNY